MLLSGCGGGGSKTVTPTPTPSPIAGVNIYYVSATSTSNDWTAALNISTPCTPDIAMANAQAGDTVYFLAGTYQTEPVPGEVQAHYRAKWQPAHSGTAAAPITFASYPGAKVIINGNLPSETVSAQNSPDMIRVFSTGQQDYIIFDGFTIQANNGAKMGSIIIGYDIGGWDNPGSNFSDHCSIRNCTFYGGSRTILCTDNRECIRIECATNTTVENCIIRDCRQQDNWHNTSAIKMYENKNTTIKNCEIFNCATGIYDKRWGDSSTFCYNYIHNCEKSIITGGGKNSAMESNHPDMKIYHNVIAYSEFCSIQDIEEQTAHSDRMEIYNNTIYSRGSTFVSISLGGGTGKKFYNNIIYGPKRDDDLGILRFVAYIDADSAPVEIAECDHNQFGDLSGNFLIKTYKTPKGVINTYTSLATWQASTELAGGGHPGSGSLASNPRFSNASGNMAQLADFRLASDSPCRGAGRNGADMGADISRVGPQH